MAPPYTSPFHTLKVGSSLWAKTRAEYLRLMAAAVRYRSRYGVEMRLRSLHDADGWHIYRLS